MKINKINSRIWVLVLIMIGFIFSPYTITKLTTRGQTEIDPEVLGEEYNQLEEEYLAMKEEEEQILAEMLSDEEGESFSGDENWIPASLPTGRQAQGMTETEDGMTPNHSVQDVAPNQTVQGGEEENNPETTSVVDQIIDKLNQEIEETEEAEVVDNFDPATAPSQVSLKVLLKETQKVPDFEVRVSFVGVGREPLEAEIDGQGKIKTELGSGRYYLKFEIENEYYKLEKDSPAFFLLPNKELDLGDVYLEKVTSQR